METLEQKLNEFEAKIQTLNDQDLVKQMQILLDREKRLGDAFLLALREIRARRIDAAMGYGSLFEMLVKLFKLSESSAYTRLQALKLMDAVPGVQDSLVSGELSLSNAALVQQFIQQNEKETKAPLSLEDKNEIIDRVKNKTSREAKNELANQNPQFGLPPEKEKPLPLKFTQVQMNLDAETMEQLNEVKVLLSHKIPNCNLKDVFKYMLNLTANTLKKRKGQEIPKDCDSTDKNFLTSINLEKQKESLVSKKVLENNNKFSISKEILGDRINSLHEKIQTQKNKNSVSESILQTNILINNKNITSNGTDVRGNKIALMNSIETNQNVNPTNPKKDLINSSKRNRYIPISVRKKVFQRANGCCEFVGSEGTRCSSQHQLEFDHIVAWSRGGNNDENSLQILCRQHNQFRVKETHGFWYQKR